MPENRLLFAPPGGGCHQCVAHLLYHRLLVAVAQRPTVDQQPRRRIGDDFVDDLESVVPERPAGLFVVNDGVAVLGSLGIRGAEGMEDGDR